MAIKILTTGGTIDKTYFDAKDTYQVGAPQVSGLLERANVTIEYEVTPLLQKDSLEINDADRKMIRDSVLSSSESQVLITHGTDSMIKTAEALQGISDKTIVLTGAMYPAQYRDSDAVFNIGGALLAVQTLPQGVYIAMNGQVFDPIKSVKNIELKRFEAKPE